MLPLPFRGLSTAQRKNRKVAAQQEPGPTVPSIQPMIPHLKGREAPFRAAGWRRADAEWIALVCLYGGLFTRSQYADCRHSSSMSAVRFVRRLLAARAAVEEAFPALGWKSRLVRICDRQFYEAAGLATARHRRTGSKNVLLRRLLSLDYVLEHPELPWLATEMEKVLYCRQWGIGPDRLPQRLYGGAAGRARRYFNARMPIAADRSQALFVYTDTEEKTRKGLQTWGADHLQLWRELRLRGLRVRVVAVARQDWCLTRCRRLLKKWAEGALQAKESVEEEIARIRRAIDEQDEDILAEYGGLSGASRFSLDLKKSSPTGSSSKASWIDEYACWSAPRLAGMAANLVPFADPRL